MAQSTPAAPTGKPTPPAITADTADVSLSKAEASQDIKRDFHSHPL
jgi:hypothetical protein